MFFVPLSEMVITIQHLIKSGWTFAYDGHKLTATKKDKTFVEYNSVEELINDIKNYEENIFTKKIIAWNGKCPNCNISPPINQYNCKICGWEL